MTQVFASNVGRIVLLPGNITASPISKLAQQAKALVQGRTHVWYTKV